MHAYAQNNIEKSTEKADITALSQAAEWFALLRDARVSKADHAQWLVWLAAHPQHQAAWAEVQAIHTPFQQLTNVADTQAAKTALLNTAKVSRRNALKLISFGGTALFTGLLLKEISPWRDWVTNIAARDETLKVAVGETQLFTLSEGTKLWLNTNSQVDIAYSFAMRRLTLTHGELLIESAKDTTEPARPLVVDTMHGRLTALGTRFTVKLSENHTFLAVYEGAVSIAPVGGGATQIIHAGQQTQFTSQHILPIEAADNAREAWTRGILLADNRRLDDFIAELALYRTDTLTVAPQIAHLRLMGAYPLKDTQRVLASIAEALPVHVRQGHGNTTELVKR